MTGPWRHRCARAMIDSSEFPWDIPGGHSGGFGRGSYFLYGTAGDLDGRLHARRGRTGDGATRRVAGCRDLWQSLEEARSMLLDAAREMVASYRDEGREPPLGAGHVEPITI